MNFKEDIILENERVRLSPLGEMHLEKMLPIALQTPDLLQYSPSPFGTKTAMQTYFDIAFQNRKQETRYAFAIFDKQMGRFAGSTSYGNISLKNQRVEIGWTWIAPEFQRTGLNRNCKFLLLRYGFETLNLERIELKTDARNTQSKTAIEAIGGQFEGVLRSNTLMRDGHRRDTVYYSILKAEWPEVKERIFSGFA